MFRALTSGAVLSPTSTLSLSPTDAWGPAGSGVGYYAACVSKLRHPTKDADYKYVAGALLAVTAPTAFA